MREAALGSVEQHLHCCDERQDEEEQYEPLLQPEEFNDGRTVLEELIGHAAASKEFSNVLLEHILVIGLSQPENVICIIILFVQTVFERLAALERH